jgi:hypothetical protein
MRRLPLLAVLFCAALVSFAFVSPDVEAKSGSYSCHGGLAVGCHGDVGAARAGCAGRDRDLFGRERRANRRANRRDRRAARLAAYGCATPTAAVGCSAPPAAYHAPAPEYVPEY